MIKDIEICEAVNNFKHLFIESGNFRHLKVGDFLLCTKLNKISKRYSIGGIYQITKDYVFTKDMRWGMKDRKSYKGEDAMWGVKGDDGQTKWIYKRGLQETKFKTLKASDLIFGLNNLDNYFLFSD